MNITHNQSNELRKEEGKDRFSASGSEYNVCLYHTEHTGRTGILKATIQVYEHQTAPLNVFPVACEWNILSTGSPLGEVHE